MFLLYLQIFCRVVIGLVFTISFLGKAFHLSSFQRSILAFNILPARFSRPAALLFLSGEGAVVILVGVGGSLLGLAFVLAILLLLVFSCALLSVLIRKLQTSCNCFGPTEKQVSSADIWRNIGFLLCASSGFCTVVVIRNNQASPDVAAWGWQR